MFRLHINLEYRCLLDYSCIWQVFFGTRSLRELIHNNNCIPFCLKLRVPFSFGTIKYTKYKIQCRKSNTTIKFINLCRCYLFFSFSSVYVASSVSTNNECFNTKSNKIRSKVIQHMRWNTPKIILKLSSIEKLWMNLLTLNWEQIRS